MSGYLLDTNVVSTFSPMALARHPALVGWIGRQEGSLYLPSVVIAELSAGVARLRRIGASRKAELLDLWLLNLVGSFERRIVDFDTPAAQATGILLDKALAKGLNPAFADLAIGGVATVRGLTLLTRNLRHFLPLGVAALDPFEALPP